MAREVFNKDQIVKEVLKCSKDPIYFLKNYVRISHPIRGYIRFSLYPFQEVILRDFTNFRYNICLKSRQLGVSTLIAGYCCWLMLFHREKSILIMATKLATATNLLRKTRAMYKSIPNWLRISSLKVDNRTSFELENGSFIKATASSGDVGRSEALSLLVVDEAAHIEKMEDLWTAVAPTLATGGNCVAVSSPNGAGGWFYKTYIDAEAGLNDFHSSKYEWNVHPERDLAWFEHETRQMTKRDIAQEFNASFNMSGQTVFDPDDIERMEKILSEPIYKTGFDRNLWIWEEYNPEDMYFISADVSRGDAEDYSVCHLFKLGQVLHVAAEYQGKAPPDLFSKILMELGQKYGNCMIVVENNAVGYAVLKDLIEANYPNIYYSVKSTHEFIEQLDAENRAGAIAGFSTTSKTRPLIVAKLEEFIRNDIVRFCSRRMYNEMKTFVWNQTRPEAMRGYADDLIMAAAIGAWVRDAVFTSNARESEYKRSFIGAMFKTRTTFNSSIGGQIGAPLKEEHRDLIELYKQFSWVYKG